MATQDLRNLRDKDTLINCISAHNKKLELAIEELTCLAESARPDICEFKQSLVKGLKSILYGLQS